MAEWLAISSLCVVVTLLSVSQLALYHHFGAMYVRSPEGRANQGPELGSRPTIQVVHSYKGDLVELPRRGPAIIMFAATTCKACDRLKPVLRDLFDGPAGLHVALQVVCRGTEQEVSQWAQDIPVSLDVVPDPAGAIAAKYNVALSPVFVGMDGNLSVVQRGIMNSGEELLQLVGRVTGLEFKAARNGVPA